VHYHNGGDSKHHTPGKRQRGEQRDDEHAGAGQHHREQQH
jgi:hypothetical protein